MSTTRSFRRVLPVCLAAALFLSFWAPVFPVSATEVVEEAPDPVETVSVPETAAPTEAAVTEPVPVEETEAPVWTEAATEPIETVEETWPLETAAVEEVSMALFSAAPVSDAFERIYGLEELTSGEYVLVTGAGYAPGALQAQDQWITAVQPTVDGDTVTDAAGGVWTLTAGNGVTLTDSFGLSIAPGGSGENGISAAVYHWQVSCEDGLFSFHGSNGTEPVTLAGNKSLDCQFRAYRDSTVQASPEAYPSAFALYKRPGSGTSAETWTLSTVAQAKTMAEGTEGITLQGTVVYASDGLVLLQDATGGIALSFDGAFRAARGDVLLVVGRRTGGLAVTMCEKTGTAECPAGETTISGIGAEQEYTRVLIRDAVLGDGMLMQGEATILLAAFPEGVSIGDTVDAYGVVIDGRFYADTLVPAAKPEAGTPWYPVEIGDILPGDLVLITMAKDGRIWALSSANGEKSVPGAVEVQPGDGIPEEQEEYLNWNVFQEEAGLILRPVGKETWLYTSSSNSGVRVGSMGTPYWQVDGGYLKHISTRRYLSVNGSASWQTPTHTQGTAAGQTLQFWRRERTVSVTVTPEGGGIAPGESIALQCATEGAVIYYAASSDGEHYTEFSRYTGEITPEPGFGSLYIKAYAAKEGYSPSPETVSGFTEESGLEWNLYFGQLHAHTDISDGTGSVAEAFAHAARVEGLDFFAVTDHSNSFDNAASGAIALDGTAVSRDWAAGKAAAAAVTNADFVGIFGYEMTWQEGKHLGHINTFNTPGWQTRDQEGFGSLEGYYEALTAVPGSISQFNHPGTAYGNFENFSHYRGDYDRQLTLLELGDEGDFSAYKYYIQALDAGWHVAPTSNQNNHNGAWGDANASRTVALAKDLTEESLFDAMRNYRVYATGDSDLRIYYELDGHIMGSILDRADSPEVSVSLWDPTDTVIGKVEVVVDGGVAAAERTVGSSRETLTMKVPGGYSYYFLRITQPDGDIAVTAPVWVDSYTDMGIGSFIADTELPVQGQEVALTLELFNEETVDLVLDGLEFYIGDACIHAVDAPGTVKALDTLSYTFQYTHSGLGVTEVRAAVSGHVNGEARSYGKTLTLRYRAPEMVTGILVDGSHGNFGIDALENLTAIAARANMEVTVFTGELPQGGSLLLVSAPEAPFEEVFLERVRQFVENGGILIVCGRADGAGIFELNRLLAAAGSTMRLNSGTAVDKVNNGGSTDALSASVFNTDAGWSAALTSEQFYSQHSGCTVEVGSGTWLVKGLPTTYSVSYDGGPSEGGNVLLAWEETASGGTVFAAGCLFLADSEMPAPKNLWDTPRANQTILEALLNVEKVELPLSSIASVRNGKTGGVYRVKGYVTAGTSNPYNTFDKTIYLQDGTGGIAVMPFTETGVQVGTPMEVVGYLDVCGGNPVLELITYRSLEEDLYRYVPKTMYHSTAMDYAAHGGELLQVEGAVVSVTYTADGKGVSRFTLKDIRGDLATVYIEDSIFSGASGVNDLASQVKPGRTVRAMGILHLDDSGEPVLRVRNCEEVVYVPPIPDPSNPKTGDSTGLGIVWSILERRK